MNIGDIEFYLLYSSKSTSGFPFIWVPSLRIASYLGHYTGNTLEDRIMTFINDRSYPGHDDTLDDAIKNVAEANSYPISSFTYTHSNELYSSSYEYW